MVDAITARRNCTLCSGSESTAPAPARSMEAMSIPPPPTIVRRLQEFAKTTRVPAAGSLQEPGASAATAFSSLKRSVRRAHRINVLGGVVGSRDTPDRVADIVGNQQRARLVDCDANRAAVRFFVGPKEASQHVDRLPGWFAIGEWHEDNLIAAERLTVPRTVLSDERAVAELFGQLRAAREGQAERRDVVAERIVRHGGPGDKLRILRLDAAVDVLTPVAERPAVKTAILHRSEIVGDQIAAEFVAFVHHSP